MGGRPIADLTYPEQLEFIAWLKDRGYKNSHVSRVLSVGHSLSASRRVGAYLVASEFLGQAGDLNQKGRKQANRYKPVVPVTKTLAELFRGLDGYFFALWHGDRSKASEKPSQRLSNKRVFPVRNTV